MTGRAVTAMYMPSRPDVEKNIKESGARAGKKRQYQFLAHRCTDKR